eukprot:scaffold147951_cov31-Tisochrysis_lutea.AAC.2
MSRCASETMRRSAVCPHAAAHSASKPSTSHQGMRRRELLQITTSAMLAPVVRLANSWVFSRRRAGACAGVDKSREHAFIAMACPS